jgi:ribose 5-phosphate isomerase B
VNASVRAVKWYAGSDHAGRALKDKLVARLRALGDDVVDVGCHDDASVDYPDFAEQVARSVAAEDDARGLLVCGTGIGMSIAANKVSGVRAAVVTDPVTARASRAHNDANVIALGERVTGSGVAEAALEAFRDTAFEGGRHARRVGKIRDLE